MYRIKGDGITIYSDISHTESRKATSPKLNLKDNAAGSLELTLPPGNAGYEALKRMTSEIIVYRDGEEVWAGRILTEKNDFWNNRILTCEGELSYLHDTIQPQRKYPEGTTVGEFLEAVLAEHNKRYSDNEERYKFYLDKSYVYNYNETIQEIITDYDNTFDCIISNIVEVFECHILIEKIDGKKYIKMVKEEAYFNENTQVIRFGENLLDFSKNWDLTDMGTVIVPKGATIEAEATEDSDAFDTYVSLNEIPMDNVVEYEEIGEYRRNPDGSLAHDEDMNLIYDRPQKVDEYGNLVYTYKKDENGYITLESETLKDGSVVPTIRVDTKQSTENKIRVEFLDYADGSEKLTTVIETDGLYANIYYKDDSGEFYSLKDEYGRVEKVVEFSDAEDSVDLLKKTREYLLEHRFDQMTLEVSAVDLRYLSRGAEPIKMLDRVRCISHPHGMNTLFTVTELSIELDKPDSAQYTLQKSLDSPAAHSSLSETLSAATSEIESQHSTILKRAKSDADKLLRENVNGYITLVTDENNGRHSEAFVISSGRNYKLSEHFWIWNVNGLGHYTEYGNGESPTLDADDQSTEFWENGKKYVLNLGITMDGAIVANRITVGHMSADRVRTGVLISQDGNVVWNLNAETTHIDDYNIDVPGGSMLIKKGSINLGNGAFTVDDNGFLHAEKGTIGGFEIEADNIHNDGMKLDSEGVHFWSGDPNTKSYENLGFLGQNFWNDLPSVKSLAMNMEHDGSAIWWAYRENSSDDTYTVKLMYVAQEFAGYEADTLHALCDLDMHGMLLKNAEISDVTLGGITINPNDCTVSGALSQTVQLLLPGAIKSDGTIDISYIRTVKIKNGFILPN